MNNNQASPTTTTTTTSMNNSNCLSPFNIKRKCLSKLSTNHHLLSSPSYSISTINLTSNSATNSPSHLNDSFDENMANKRYRIKQNKYSIGGGGQSRRSVGWSRYRSAPLQIDTDNSSPKQQQQQPLNDISNIFQLKHKLMLAATTTTTTSSTLSTSSSSSSEEQNMTDLENLLYGNLENQQQILIKQSLEVDATCNGLLIGDRSKKHILSTIISNKHQDLHCIPPNTLVDVLEGKFNDQIDECIVIDSRYPYEYDAGHIRNAKNIYTKQKLYDEFFLQKHQSLDISKRIIIIFHCEFSSERAPTLLKFLRNQDRCLNEPIYPNLFYPELYLLEGGYKSFYLNFKNYCEPQDYKPMLHAEHSNDLRHFRAKAKSCFSNFSNELTRHKTIFKFTSASTSTSDQTNESPTTTTTSITDSPHSGHKVIKMKSFIH